MFNLAIKLLLSRKNWLILMVCSLAIIISALTSIFSSSEIIRTGLLERAYSQYGQHSGILIGLNETKNELEDKTKQVGEFQLVDTYSFLDKKATIGWMDQDAIDLSYINVLEGHFPEKVNEVAIESAYLNYIDPAWQIGESKTLVGENQHWEVKLVGILSNYSSKWSVPDEVEKGVSDFPNIFIHENSYKKEPKTHHFLVYLGDGKNTTVGKMENLLSQYGNKGYINDQLFFKGLKDYALVLFLSISFQVILFLVAFFYIHAAFSYFNKEQMKKIAILRALGLKYGKIYLLYFWQCLVIFLSSLVLAIPLQSFFQYLMIKISFKEALAVNTQLQNVYLIIISCLILMFLSVFYISCRPVRKNRFLSVKTLMNNLPKTNYLNPIERKLSNFVLKQLAKQLFTWPKQLFYMVAMICISILVLICSIITQKEIEGIWNLSSSYYLSAQQGYGWETIDHMPVLLNQGLAFSSEDVDELENLPKVKYIEKKPFMDNVVPFIHSEQIIPLIHPWIQEVKGSAVSDDKQMLTNITYQIIDSNEFDQIYPKGSYKDFKGKILLFIPNEDETITSGQNSLIGSNFYFKKWMKEENVLNKMEEEFEVYDVLTRPLTKHVPGIEDIQYDDLTIVFDKETMQKSNLFPGYIELEIFLEDNLTNNQYQLIDDKVSQLIATIPGSLFQNIPKLIQEDGQLAPLVAYLGKFTFIISSLLTILSLIMILFSKYQMQKREWGIYLSLGMTKKGIFYFLAMEMLCYLFISTTISTVIFLIYTRVLDIVYPMQYYLWYFIAIVFLMSLFLLDGSFIIYRKITKNSIFSMLREVE
ncbi:ABC transporter permease [Lederbergia sp. NSJ-179]|uniref:ABC transporter permease n=1 Tax=Lederbergia sp. NSJ-179 TaxID=2931402 RepID=UPI001FCF8C4E|nr:ABC transporter permease [Lederbergia sp. NSJ-179]MCJ7843138.1 ABC transporter permease [Lederbergia sp. NSJ-179]